MDYQAIEDAVHNTLQGDSWLGDTNNVTTFEKGRRFYSLVDKEVLQYFSLDELPAIGVLVLPETKRQEPHTTDELLERVNVEVQSVVRANDANRSTGQSNSRTIIKNIERVMDQQKTSSNDLGLSSECGYVLRTVTRETLSKDGDYWIFMATTTVEVEVVNQIST